ncbi:hypothetical protein [Roseisalinus antarcticus]|uniref:Uncharacterized protein n=1 Tax=Roseisalinus antarcticus TaxID=254357 RepID=A0A1Y5TUY7_9RHOB|nr:hypothetical protein [Roseisalinus antarcticus]SLN68916.1 hypothetical protein ROA7023_03340 [Roseisalinus antarcticus]
MAAKAQDTDTDADTGEAMQDDTAEDSSSVADRERELGERLALSNRRLKRATEEIAALTRHVQILEGALRKKDRAFGQALLFDNVAIRLPYIGRWPWVARRAMRYRARRIVRAGLFDPKWYVQEYPDIAETGVDPARHYLRAGWREGRLPRADMKVNPLTRGQR